MKLKGILAISESLYPRQKEIIEKAFECKIISFYGHTEGLIFAGNTPCEEGYLLDPRYGFTEIINGELVGTGFINKATPLLRYKTGDIASVLDENRKSSDLFSMMRLEKVEGRWRQEIIIGKSGSKISITALNMHSAIFKNVERFQFYQNRPGKVELRIVPLSTYSEAKDSPAIDQGF